MKALQLNINSDFKCRQCNSYVPTTKLLAGVGNRNHCPYCLWSRHLDLFEAGDRLSACKAPMRPVGLTLKRSRNKYGSAASGELMLVHQCTECDRISINRVAADDIPEVILEVFEDSLSKSTWLQKQILGGEINLLGNGSSDIVYQRLYGQAIRPALEAAPTI